MNIVAMIPARLGSKRIPKKNIRYMLDKPLVRYPLDLAVNSGLFDSVYLNSDCVALKSVSYEAGAMFYERLPNLASDTATNRDFVYDFLTNTLCDFVVMINPTSPLLRPKTLCRFIDYVKTGDYDTVLSVISEKAETFYNGRPLNFSLKEKINSQLLPPTEKIVWALTAWKRETFLSLQENGDNPVYGGRIGRFAIPKDECCDLDEPEDWRIAEGILLSRKSQMEEKYMDLE